MRQFHHVGIPTIRQRPNEIYLEGIKLYITDAGAHPYHVEWVRVAPGCTLPSLLHSAPHVTHMSRLDETRAARFPVLRWTPGMDVNKLQADAK